LNLDLWVEKEVMFKALIFATVSHIEELKAHNGVVDVDDDFAVSTSRVPTVFRVEIKALPNFIIA
jgi:hypothetical protein